MARISEFLIQYPELAVFLAIALGYVIGGIKLGSFSLGPVTGALIAGLAIGQLGEIPVSGMAKSFLFLLFLVGIGYSVGPQVLQAMRRGGVGPIVLAIVCTGTGLVMALIVAHFLGLDPGFSAGLLSGALTQSAALGTATEAIGALDLPDAQRDALVAHAAIADAICYVFGAVGTIWFLSTIAPRILGIDLVKECAALEAKLGIDRKVPGFQSGYAPVVLRAYVTPDDAAVIGLTVEEAEARYPDARLYILRLRRGERIIEAVPDLRIEAGDVLAIGGRLHPIIDILGPKATEVEDQELLDAPFLALDVLLTSKGLAGVTLEQAATRPWAHGISLRSIRRGAQLLPPGADLVLQRGDVLSIYGPQGAVEAASPEIGTVIAPSNTTDFVVLGLAIFLGGLVGTILQFTIGGIEIMIGTSVGALLAGLVVGHLRVRFPLFGRIPDGAVALMTALGLAAFVAMTGLHAGPVFISALQTTGLGLLIGGLLVTLSPILTGLAVGHWVFRMNPVLLLGGIAGAMTMTASMAALQERGNSPVPVLGYTPAYPVANILLTIWGSLIVTLMQ
jgi:putative transport protein